jgi:hypothetical protein
MTCPAARALLLLALLGACRTGSGGGSAPAAGEEPAYRAADPAAARTAFWGRIAHLDLDGARRAAPDAEHRGFVEALRLTLDGELDAAAGALRRQARDGADSLLREAARTTLVSVLSYRGDWEALYALSLGAEPEEAGEEGRGDTTRSRDRAGVLAWSRAMRLAAPAAVPALSRPAVLPMRLSATGTPVVTVRINGCTRTFWLDTGSSTTLVASDVAAQCGVSPIVADTLEMVTTTGRVAARPAVIASLSVGPIAATNVHGAIIGEPELQLTRVWNSPGGPPGPVRLDGVIGFDFLRRYDVELDYAKSRVTFRPAGSMARARKMRRNLFWLGFPVVELIDPSGRPAFFGLDTGADATFITPGLIDRLPKAYRARERRHIAGFGGDTTVTVPVLRFLQMRVQQYHLFFTGVLVRDQRHLLFLDVDGVLGADFGGVGRVRFDMQSGTLAVMDP